MNYQAMLKVDGIYRWITTMPCDIPSSKIYKVKVEDGKGTWWHPKGGGAHGRSANILDRLTDTFALDAPAQDLRTLL